MKKICLALALVAASHGSFAMMCFKAGERVSGMNKMCFYTCPNGTAAITVASYELCPITIDN